MLVSDLARQMDLCYTDLNGQVLTIGSYNDIWANIARAFDAMMKVTNQITINKQTKKEQENKSNFNIKVNMPVMFRVSLSKEIEIYIRGLDCDTNDHTRVEISLMI